LVTSDTRLFAAVAMATRSTISGWSSGSPSPTSVIRSAWGSMSRMCWKSARLIWRGKMGRNARAHVRHARLQWVVTSMLAIVGSHGAMAVG
jgi:hypothetical protein